MKKDDELEVSLNPHRAEERAAASRETAARLHSRGIEVSGQEDSEDLADLLSAVERFEEWVEARGGDLMVDDLNSSEPDDPHFVVPQREPGETLRSYIGRIDAAAAGLRDHPTLPGEAPGVEA
jgi:hypothetical protein